SAPNHQFSNPELFLEGRGGSPVGRPASGLSRVPPFSPRPAANVAVMVNFRCFSDCALIWPPTILLLNQDTRRRPERRVLPKRLPLCLFAQNPCTGLRT